MYPSPEQPGASQHPCASSAPQHGPSQPAAAAAHWQCRHIQCKPLPSRIEILPVSLPLPPNTAEPPGEGQENWVQCCSPVPESEGGEAQSHTAWHEAPLHYPSEDGDMQGSRAQSKADLTATRMPRSSFPGHHKCCRETLPFFKTREGISSPISSSLSFPLSRTTSSPFSTKASKIAYK